MVGFLIKIIVKLIYKTAGNILARKVKNIIADIMHVKQAPSWTPLIWGEDDGNDWV